MVCCLCILVPMAHMSHGTEAPTHKELAQGECGQFCHFGTCGLNSGHHHAMAHGDLWEPSMYGLTLDSHWVPHRMLSPIWRLSWRNTFGDTLMFGTFLGMPNHPCWEPSFSPPCGPLAASYLKAHKKLGPNSKSGT